MAAAFFAVVGIMISFYLELAYFWGFMGEIAFLMPNNFAVVYLFVILVMKLK